MMTYAGNRNMRRKKDIIMLEGKRLNFDALEVGLKPKKIFFTQPSFWEEVKSSSYTNLPLFKIPYNTMKLWSKLDTPPGVIGFYPIPKEKDIVAVDSLPIKVLCDNVRDPGNLGAIIRVAASVGCKEVILMKGCTDPWDSKVLRSASGGHFHIPITTDLEWQQQKEFLEPSDVVFLSDSHSTRSYPPSCTLPVHVYYDVSYLADGASVVVVVGGETEGLSREAFALASRRAGARVYIPLSNNMESLNSGSAVSVVLFEIKKQFLMRKDRLLNDTAATEDSCVGGEDDRRDKRTMHSGG